MGNPAVVTLQEAAIAIGISQHELITELSKLRIPNLRLYKGCKIPVEHIASVVLNMKGGGYALRRRRRQKSTKPQ